MSGIKQGHCLCGAVQVEAALGDEISACHCGMCAHWSGSAMMGIMAPADTVKVSGPVKTYRSSSFAERAWCDTCGSSLWFRDDGEDYEFMPGIFENAGDGRLVRIVYADCAPDGWDYGGSLKRVSRTDYEKSNKFVPEGEKP